jgi:hypothetical protein
MAIFAPDLTQRAPRSPRIRLGGYAVLPRVLDKGRATIAKKNGEYIFDCPLDKIFLNFVGLTGAQLKKELAKGKSDSEILAWIEKHAKHHRCAGEIHLWSSLVEQRAPSNVEMRTYYNENHTKLAPQRADLVTFFDLLDVDDYVTFGGQP